MIQDYLGSIELKNNVVKAVYKEEGWAYNTESSYCYEYVLSDQRNVAPQAIPISPINNTL
ncbi:hypothetical protein GCM10028774_65340 [Spirosoma jeollabukense]